MLSPCILTNSPHKEENFSTSVRRSSGVLCVNGGPLGEGMKTPAILHGLRDVEKASVRRDLTSGDFHGVGSTLEFLIQPLNGIRAAQQSPVARVELEESE